MDENLLNQATGALRPSPVSKSTRREPDMNHEAQVFRQCFYEVEPNFDPSKSNRDILNTVFAWIWKDEKINALGVDFNKGFFFYGPLGRGKTMTLQAMRCYMNSVTRRFDWLKEEDFRLKAWWKTASELANIYAADGQPALSSYVDADVNLVIDEFGREPNPANNFGTKMNVLQFILQLRYDHRRTSVTHITTNRTPDDLEPIYGDYVADRCKEMFNFIEFSGVSLR